MYISASSIGVTVVWMPPSLSSVNVHMEGRMAMGRPRSSSVPLPLSPFLVARTRTMTAPARRCVIGSFPALPPSFRLPKAKVPKREITVSPLTPARAPNPLWVCPPRSTTQGDFSPALFSVFQLRYRRVHKWLFGYLVKW